MNARLAALRTINQVIVDQQSLSQSFKYFTGLIENPQEKKLYHQLVYGTLRYYPSLEQTLNLYLQKKIPTKNIEVKNILIIAIYQLHFLEQAPYAIINESVNLCNNIKKDWAKGLINAVLRQFNERHEFVYDPQQDCPTWLYQKIKATYPDSYQAICAAHHQAPVVMLRPHQITQTDYCTLLDKEGIDYSKHIDHKETIILNQSIDVTTLPLFKNGKVTVQNANAQLAANLLGIKEQTSVLDACAAPGGKTAHIATKAKDIQITTVDNSKKRSQRLIENLDRLNVKTNHFVADLADTDQWYQGELFDRILLDAPCSGTGVIQKHPDILYLRNQENIDELIQTQRKLLLTCWDLLKPNGILLYATCSILPEENNEQIQYFLDQKPDASLKKLGHNRSVSDKKSGVLQFIPDAFGDGFFYAAIQKAAQ